MELSISVFLGQGILNVFDNVEDTNINSNIILRQDDLKSVYEELFSDALKEYNEARKKASHIADYYEHIKNGKQEKLFYDCKFQLGNSTNCNEGSKAREIVTVILQEFYKEFETRNPNLRVFNCIIQLDQLTPYIVISFVPFAKNQTRGLSTKNSLKQAFAQQNIIGKNIKETEQFLWLEQEKKILSEIALEHSILVVKGIKNTAGYEMQTFKTTMENVRTMQKELAELQTKKQEKLSELEDLENNITDLENMVDLVKNAENVRPDIHAIKPQTTITKAVRGITVEQVENLKILAIQNEQLKENKEQLQKNNSKLKTERLEVQSKSLILTEEIQNIFAENSKLLNDKKIVEEKILIEKDFSKQLLKYTNLITNEDFTNLTLQQIRSEIFDLVAFYEEANNKSN